ncbi:MAG: 4-(cytidine 5'-diphospho)-2-C-methyl-D-erythritol kinase [Chitinophagaceae bacterium]|nr:4-(cytidine 5'-diphospho)-2-C-methyl-D-erythritol kinase [Chitinophagaceae bacterium]
MISFPNCKINLGLQILNKREDGYHNLATVFYPVQWRDVVEVIRRDDGRQTTDHSGTSNLELTTKNSELVFTSSGLEIAGPAESNLCIKAYHLLKKDFPSLPPVQMHLHKTIPMGAGLGGGSADGAFTLKLLNDKFQLGLTQEQLIDYALQLGSDCPFFIVNKPCYATGRGEILEEVALDLSAYQFVLVNPGIHINTGWAFEQLQLQGSGRSERPDPKNIVQQPIHTWKEQLINDFEEPVCKAHPQIAAIKQQLYDTGALYASITGSGSTVFGVFEKGKQVRIDFSKEYLVKNV